MENQLASQFETLLPLVIAWAREQEQVALSQGIPLSEPELFEARRVGVREPHKVRLLKVESIPVPSHPLLQAAIRAINLVPAAPRGLTLNYAIFVRSDCWGNRPLIVHELVHTAQYERLGGIEAFLRAYLTQCTAVGYTHSAMETEARGAASELCPGVETGQGVNLLLQTIHDAEVHFGQKATMASNLLGMVGEGERAFGFLTGDLSEGFAVTVGTFNGRIRYAAFNKRTGEAWGEGDLRAVLAQIGPYSNWILEKNTEFFDYEEKQDKTIVAEATGWQSPRRRYAFAYVPDFAGEIGLLPDRSAIDRKFGFA